MIKILCYGAGKRFDSFMRILDVDNVEIIAIADKDIENATAKANAVSDKAVAVRPNEIPLQIFDYIVICSDGYAGEMLITLLSMGLERNKICFAGDIPTLIPTSLNVRSMAENYFYAVNENKEILSLLVKADIPSYFIIRDLLNIRRQRRIREFYNKAKDDYVRISTLELLANQIITKKVEGNIAELGVWKGNFASLINELLPDKTMYLFDTFEGFDTANYEYDYCSGYITNSQASNYFTDTSVDLVLSRMPNREKCIVKIGVFPDSLGNLSNDDTIRFCLVSIDPDLYAPVYEGIKWFYPRLSVGGYIMIHDYECPTFRGARNAVDDICKELGVSFTPISDENGSVIITKSR